MFVVFRIATVHQRFNGQPLRFNHTGYRGMIGDGCDIDRRRDADTDAGGPGLRGFGS